MVRLTPARADDLVVVKDAGGGAAAGVPRRARRVAVVAAAAGFVAYFVALHALIVTGALPALTLALVLAPWAVAAASLLTKAVGRPVPARLLAVALGALAAVVAATWATKRFGIGWWRHADVVLYCENLAFFGWLASLFASSLFGDREALVTRMARRVRSGDMPRRVVRYTRGVTAAWAVFFVAAMALSTLLFFDASRETWSTFVNLLMWPLVGTAFAIEYAVRQVLLRDIDHAPFSAAFRAFHDLDRGADATDRR